MNQNNWNFFKTLHNLPHTKIILKGPEKATHKGNTAWTPQYESGMSEAWAYILKQRRAVVVGDILTYELIQCGSFNQFIVAWGWPYRAETCHNSKIKCYFNDIFVKCKCDWNDILNKSLCCIGDGNKWVRNWYYKRVNGKEHKLTIMWKKIYKYQETNLHCSKRFMLFAVYLFLPKVLLWHFELYNIFFSLHVLKLEAQCFVVTSNVSLTKAHRV
jgi:hypothetical protein